MDKFIEKVAEETKDETSIDVRELMLRLDRLTEAVNEHTQITGKTVVALDAMADTMQKMEKIMSGVIDLASIQAFREGDNMMAVLLRDVLKK